MRLRVPVAVALTGVVLVATAGCGDPEQVYCDALQADQPTFAQMEGDTSGLALLRHEAMLRQLASKAPNDLTDEWQTFLGAITSFSGTLHELGVDPGDFADGKPPAGLSAEQRTRIAQAASALSSDDVVEAANGIEQQAKDVCKLQLGL